MSIKRALVSVSDKQGIVDFCRELSALGVEIISTGGTSTLLAKEGVPVIGISDVTGFPEIMDGRVKTLHPAVHSGLLAVRDNEEHTRQMTELGLDYIDLVVVNLYPFAETIAKPDVSYEEAIENIDIGGPTMLRSAAKNHAFVSVVVDAADYANVLEEVRAGGDTTFETRKRLAAKVFRHTAAYDALIADYLANVTGEPLPERYTVTYEKIQDLRYGENPHQKAKFYGDTSRLFTQLNGKAISYNNLVDIDAALHLVAEFNEPGFAIIKHTNVCGVALRHDVLEGWKAALAGDPESAFGGVLVSNQVINKATAEAINDIFFEVLLARGFNADALDILKAKKNRILLQYNPWTPSEGKIYKSALNGTLVQDADKGNYLTWDDQGTRQVSVTEKADLEFANIVCKHLKSNAIALVKNKQLVGKGCGQTSRIDSLRQSVEKAKQFNFDLKGAVMASDAFFPFDDCVKMGHESGITAFIQPGGSIRDKDSVAYCKDNNLAMVITGLRHFKH